MNSKTITEAKDAIEIIQLLEKENIDVWLDGGWAVDSLLGEQTRSHIDLDIVVQQKDVKKLRGLLEARGYRDVERDDTSAWNFVLGDNLGHEVDVHVIIFDNEGNGLYGPKEKGLMYPAGSLGGIGRILGYAIRCVSPGYLVKFHSGYELKEEDFKDVYALHKRFGIALPIEYDKFMETLDQDKIEKD
jgi:lincosamide nucleotidyltransferase A/C/D/E